MRSFSTKFFLTLLTFFLFTYKAFAIVDMKNANFSDSWVDMRISTSGYDIRVKRSYNSRTLFNGIFGFGWCSDFETQLEVTPENNIKVTECGAGEEITFSPKGYNDKAVLATIEKMLVEVKKRNPSFTKAKIDRLRIDLKQKTFFREELARQLKMEGNIKQGQVYLANGRKDDTLRFENNHYTRKLPDGTLERFSSDGKLVALYDKNGNYLKLNYIKGTLTKVTDNNGKSLDFKYDPRLKKVKQVIGPGGLTSVYTYKGEDLVSVVNGWKNKFDYQYDDLHNLTQIHFPNKATKTLTYNQDKDWVTSFTDTSGCKETYKYDDDPKDPMNHYFSSVTKVCGKKVTNQSTYEFLHKMTKDGKRFLAMAKSTINGVRSEVHYHEKFGKPVSTFRNKVLTRFEYTPDGLMSVKREPFKTTSFEYKNSCNKVSETETSYYRLVIDNKHHKRTRKFAKKIKTAFYYSDKKCNLVTAKNSEGQFIRLAYDGLGRISKITDQSKKVVLIKYENRFGKPDLISRPGLGSIQVSYKNDGSVAKVKSKDGAYVAKQVAGVFNNLLEIISPATQELSI